MGASPWDNPRVAETIRAAASVIAARDGERGPEVLVLERSAGSPFLPGYVAFPGGATDAEDRRHALRWFGLADEAPRACAVRAPQGLQPEPDGHEAIRAWWARPTDLLEDWAAGRRKLYWPTYFTIRALADRPTADDLLALRMLTREPGPDEIARLPRSTFWQA